MGRLQLVGFRRKQKMLGVVAYPGITVSQQGARKMGGSKAKNGMAAVGKATILAILACAGCELQTEARVLFRMEDRDEYVKITVLVEPKAAETPGEISCEILIENVSSGPVAIFDSPDLPTVLYVPDRIASIFYGLTRMPSYAFYEVPEYFRWVLLEPAKSHRYACTVTNPVRERAHYGNPTYEDPESQYHGRKPEKLLWDTLLVEVAYFVFTAEVASEVGQRERWSETDLVAGRSLFESQRKISFVLKL